MMMSCQIKNSVCQWHTLHRALVIRFTSTTQQSNHQSETTIKTNHASKNHLCNRLPVGHNQQTHHTTCRHKVFLSTPNANTRVPQRCLSTTPLHASSKKKYKHSPLKQRSSRYVISTELASLMVDKIFRGESISSQKTQRLIIDVNPGKLGGKLNLGCPFGNSVC